jgi:hypothetical protein
LESQNDGPSQANVWDVGSRRVEFHAVDSSAFIGRCSVESLRPRVARQPATVQPAAPTLSSVLCDIVIAISALLMIFCIPGLVIYATMH